MPIQHAIRAALERRAPDSNPVRQALVWGAGGPLGSALLERALAAGVFTRTWGLTRAPMAPALRGFAPLSETALTNPAGPDVPARIDTAFIVFDRERHSNGRDAAFARAQPQDLPAMARRLRAFGVQRLLVVMPHTQALLPQALQRGLANLDEAAVAGLGFEHVVFIRTAQAPVSMTGLSPPQRLAQWMLSQLLWMTPQRQLPVRAAKVAALAVEVARQLPGAEPASRVLGCEDVWLAAQGTSPDQVVSAWLAGIPRPDVPVNPRAALVRRR